LIPHRWAYNRAIEARDVLRHGKGGRKVALQQSVYDRRLERRKGAAGGD